MNQEDIIEILKDDGIDIAEELAMQAAKAAIKLLRVIVPKVSVGFGLAFNLFMDAYEPQIYKMLDKIDGEKDL